MRLGIALWSRGQQRGYVPCAIFDITVLQPSVQWMLQDLEALKIAEVLSFAANLACGKTSTLLVGRVSKTGQPRRLDDFTYFMGIFDSPLAGECQ